MNGVSRIPENIFQLGATSYIGRAGQIFYGLTDGKLRLSDGVTPGGILIYPTGGSAPFSTPSTSIAAPNGGTAYNLGFTPIYPTGSFYFVNGIKRIYGTYYTISGETLTILNSPPPQVGDTHEIYTY
jgi:hypothetical protein